MDPEVAGAWTYIGDDGLKMWNAQLNGVAPIVDLQGHGWIIAGLEGDGADLHRTHRAKGWSEKEIANQTPLVASQIPLAAFGMWKKPAEITKATGKAALIAGQYPYFIWVPPSGDWKAAQQLFASEFPTEIHAGVKLIHVTIEPAPGAPLTNKVENTPTWLVELREASPGSGGPDIGFGTIARFQFRRYAYVEHFILRGY